MAFETLFLDGFDHYATAELGKKYEAALSFMTISTAQARTGAQSLRSASATGISNYVSKALGMNARTLVMGFAYYRSGNVTSARGPVALLGGADTQITLRLNTSHQFEVARAAMGSAGTVLGTSSIIPDSSWVYIELRVYIDATNGEWELRINGVTDIAGSGANTQNSGSNNFVSEVRLHTANGPVQHFDDLYIRGDTVLTAGGFLGDCKVLTRYPQANGAYAQLTPTGAASNYEAVDEASPDGDTTYVSSATVGNKDTYDFAALADPGAIKAVQLALYSRKEDAGTRLIKPYIKSGATEQAADAQALSTDYQYKLKAWETDPNTGLAFTASGLDAAEFGLEVA